MSYRMIGCLLILGVLAFTAGPATADTTVSVGTVGAISAGDTFAVDVNIASVSDLYDFQLDLSFDPSIVQLNNVSEGAFLPQGGSTLFLPGFIDNVGGTATFNIDTLIGMIPGVNGSGVLLEFDFQALAAGTSSLSLSNILLQDSTFPVGNDIDFTATDGSVTVESEGGGGGPVTTPEPATLQLLFGALGAVLVISTLRRN